HAGLRWRIAQFGDDRHDGRGDVGSITTGGAGRGKFGQVGGREVAVETAKIEDEFLLQAGDRGGVGEHAQGGGEPRAVVHVACVHGSRGVDKDGKLRLTCARAREEGLRIECHPKQSADQQRPQRDERAAPPLPPPAHKRQREQNHCNSHDDAGAPGRSVEPSHLETSAKVVAALAEDGAERVDTGRRGACPSLPWLPPLRQKERRIISSASISAAVAARAGQSGRVFPARSKSSSSRTTLTSAPGPGLRLSTARRRVSLSRGSIFTEAVATIWSPCFAV